MRINVFVVRSQFLGSALQSINQGCTRVVGPDLLLLLLPGRARKTRACLWPEASFSFLSQRSILPVRTETILCIRMLPQLQSWGGGIFILTTLLFHITTSQKVAFLFSFLVQESFFVFFLRSTNT